MATCGHRGDLPEPCPLGANAAFLCALFLSRLEVALHCIFVEASGVALGPGMSMLGSAGAHTQCLSLGFAQSSVME